MLEKYLGQKNFSQRAQRRKDIKEFEAYKKEILLNSSRTKKTLRLCALCVRFITLKLFASLKKLCVFALFARDLILLNSSHSKKLCVFAYLA